MAPRLLLVILALSLWTPLRIATAQEATPAVPTMDGPVAITGTVSVANFEDRLIYTTPTVALLDITEDLPLETPDFADRAGQILGYPTSPLFGDEPGTYRVNLPVVPTGGTLDIDDDGIADGGVQAYQLIIAANMVGDSYLQQLEQSAGRRSILRDVLTGQFLEGSLLLYAVDDQQRFPVGFGPDQTWFSGDDDLAPLAPGYTVARLAADGTGAFDRSTIPAMDALAPAAAISPDYTDQGIAASFQSLMARLKERYAYTELRQIDWDAVAATYQPRVDAADAAQDLTAYFQILTELASSIHDAHVQVAPADPSAYPLYIALVTAINAELVGSLGVTTAALSDPNQPNGPTDRIAIITVDETGPAAAAGIVPGTELVAINGLTPTERLAAIPDWYLGTFATEEKRLAAKSQLVLRFPVGTPVRLDYRLPGATAVSTAALEAADVAVGATPAPAPSESISFSLVDGYTVIRWGEFASDFSAKIAVLEEALAFHQQQAASGQAAGIILDVRGNSGGWDLLYLAMASYFYTGDAPLPRTVFDEYQYDDATQTLAKLAVPEYLLSSPRPDLTYTGPLTVLIDADCASSCEFFSQTLQATGRATVVGQYASEGAGGNVDQILLPGGILFQYTVGRSTYTGTEEPNIEARGVTPDIRLPITVDTEEARLMGQDAVLALTIATLKAVAVEETPGATPVATPEH